jgi:hypothetical protein
VRQTLKTTEVGSRSIGPLSRIVEDFSGGPKHRPLLFAALAISLLLICARGSSGQCSVNPTGETAVGLKSASSHFLTFYIDGTNKGGVPAGDRSIDFVVTPGEHLLLAPATIGGEVVSASRTSNISVGQVCTWMVTDPTTKELKSPLRREVQAVVAVAIPN